MSRISPRTSLFTALLIHCTVEIPFFIFPVILYYVGTDIFPTLGELSWIGLGSIGTVGTLAAALPSPFFGKIADKYRRGDDGFKFINSNLWFPHDWILG